MGEGEFVSIESPFQSMKAVERTRAKLRPCISSGRGEEGREESMVEDLEWQIRVERVDSKARFADEVDWFSGRFLGEVSRGGRGCNYSLIGRERYLGFNCCSARSGRSTNNLVRRSLLGADDAKQEFAALVLEKLTNIRESVGQAVHFVAIGLRAYCYGFG